ncbi:MAG: hypothetical protein SH821_14495 [Phototrophicales bacterium]|nr:hypothetical protein [Phototrophicales bacterium]
MKKILLLLCLLAGFIVPISAQEEEPETTPTSLPPIPYFVAENSARKFNVPLPFDWENASTDPNIAHFTHPDGLGDIYALSVDVSDPLSAVQNAIRQVLGDDVTLTSRYSGQFQLDGNDWGKFAFVADSGAITAFTQTRNEAVYVVFYDYPKTDHEFYFMAQNVVQTEEPQAAVLIALKSLYPELPDAPQSEATVTLSNGDWTRQMYETDASPVVALWQRRGAVVYIAVENGDGTVVDGVNKALFTSLFGFFVTPQNLDYLWLGLAVTFGIALIFVISLFARHRSLTRDEALVRELMK